MNEILRSPIFYMGNKCKLIKQLLPLFPSSCDTFIDLFGGSGVVSMNYQGNKQTIYNELNDNIVHLIEMIVQNNPEDLNFYWESQIKRYNLESKSNKRPDKNDMLYFKTRQDNYNKLRDDYNNSTIRDFRDLYLLSCYSINHLMRFNSNSDFNASSGNDSYNEITYKRVVDLHKVFKNVSILNLNALEFPFDKYVTPNTFIYCDPPYLNTEAVYNEKRAFGGWGISSDYTLFSILDDLTAKGIKFGMSNVFYNRGKSNQHLIDWTKKNQYKVYHLSRNYNPFSRGNSNSDEVYICNYAPKDNICENDYTIANNNQPETPKVQNTQLW